SVLLECFDRTAALFDGLPYQLFAASLLECARENLGLGFGGDQQNSINVAEKNIAGTDAHCSNLNRNAEVDYLVTRGRVLSVGSEAERRKAHIKDGLGISDIAIQHRARAAQLAGSRAHQFSPERVAGRGAGVHIDLVMVEIVERFEH